MRVCHWRNNKASNFTAHSTDKKTVLLYCCVHLKYKFHNLLLEFLTTRSVDRTEILKSALRGEWLVIHFFVNFDTFQMGVSCLLLRLFTLNLGIL